MQKNTAYIFNRKTVEDSITYSQVLHREALLSKVSLNFAGAKAEDRKSLMQSAWVKYQSA